MVIVSKGKSMKKRKTTQQKINDKTIEIVYDLLTKAENFTDKTTDEKWMVHHDLLSIIPMVETMLKTNGFCRTDEIIKRIKDAAETVAPTSHVAAYW